MPTIILTSHFQSSHMRGVGGAAAIVVALSVLTTFLGYISLTISVNRDDDLRSGPNFGAAEVDATSDKSLQNASHATIQFISPQLVSLPNVSKKVYSSKIGTLLHILVLSDSPDRIDALRNTWLRDVPFTVFTENPNKFPGVQAVALDARRTNFNQRRNLYLDEVPQSFYALQWGLEYTATPYVLYMEDDALVCLERLLHKLQLAPRKQYLLTGHQDWNNPRQFQAVEHPNSWFSLFSRDVLPSIVKLQPGNDTWMSILGSFAKDMPNWEKSRKLLHWHGVDAKRVKKILAKGRAICEKEPEGLLGVHAVRDTKVLQRLWQEGSPRTNQESAELPQQVREAGSTHSKQQQYQKRPSKQPGNLSMDPRKITDKVVFFPDLDDVFNKSSTAMFLNWYPKEKFTDLVVSFVDHNYLPVFDVWLQYFKSHNFQRKLLCIVATDQKAVRLVLKSLARDSLDAVVVELRQYQRNLLWAYRVNFLYKLLFFLPYNILFSDVDALWVGNPFPFLQSHQFPEADIVSSKGTFPRQCNLDGPDTCCFGFIYFRSTPSTLELITDVLKKMPGDDQKTLNCILHNDYKRIQDPVHRLQTTRIHYNSTRGRGLLMELLPYSTFRRRCSGTNSKKGVVVAHCQSDKSKASKMTAFSHFGLLPGPK